MNALTYSEDKQKLKQSLIKISIAGGVAFLIGIWCLIFTFNHIGSRSFGYIDAAVFGSLGGAFTFGGIVMLAGCWRRFQILNKSARTI